MIGKCGDNVSMLALKTLNDNMQSCNGGDFTWELNKTYKHRGKVEMCESGFHLTIEPENWEGTRVFIARASQVEKIDKSKFVCRRVILLKELSKAEIREFREARGAQKSLCSKEGGAIIELRKN
jgi:hypothetical protein